MFESILTKIYYGNSFEQWLITIGIILAAFIAGKLFYWICGNIIKKLTEKTETKLDDILIDMLEEPAMLAIMIGGIWYAIHRLILGDGVSAFFDKAIEFVIIVDITWFVARFFEAVVTEYLTPEETEDNKMLDNHLLPIARTVVKTLIWIFGIVIGFDNAGYNVGAVLAGLGIGGLALAMAAKDTVSNIFGGVMVIVDKPFKINDSIKITGLEGVVEEIGLRSTRIRTPSGTLITVPNSKFTENHVENISIEPSRKVTLKLNINSKENLEKEIKKTFEILENIVKNNSNHLLKEHKILITTFSGAGTEISFTYFIKKGANISQTQSDINIEMVKELNSHKINLV